MNTHIATEFAIYLTDKPGQLAGLLEALAVGGAEVHGVSVGEYRDRICVRIVGSTEEQIRRVCESLVESGVGPMVEAHVLLVDIDQKPDALREIACVLADHRVNIEYIYLCPGENDRPTRAAVRVADAHAASEAINNAIS